MFHALNRFHIFKQQPYIFCLLYQHHWVRRSQRFSADFWAWSGEFKILTEQFPPSWQSRRRRKCTSLTNSVNCRERQVFLRISDYKFLGLMRVSLVQLILSYFIKWSWKTATSGSRTMVPLNWRLLPGLLVMGKVLNQLPSIKS